MASTVALKTATQLDIDEAYPGWKQAGNCRRMDPEGFFPQGQGHTSTLAVARAKAVCAGCPIKEMCLEYGMDEHWGVWGGTSDADRRQIRRSRRRLAYSA